MGVFSTFDGPSVPDDGKLNVLVFGAHPDDCDLRFGGAAMKYRALGHRVKFVSMTNGDTGHYGMGGGELGKLVDIPIVVPLAETTDRIQEIHIKVLHIVIEAVERKLFPENYAG